MPARDLVGSDAPTSALSTALLRGVGILFFVLFTALGAQVYIPLPPFGVPFTLQTLAVILAALSLGPRWGSASMILYVFVGALGVPLFSGGSAGIGTILGQTGGYIAGFLVCQPVVGAIVRRRDGTPRGWGGLILATLAGHAIIFALGVPWLWYVRNSDSGLDPLTFAQAAKGGVLPYLPGMVVKAALAVVIGRLALPHAMRRIW